MREQFSKLGRDVARQLLELWTLETPALPHAAIGTRVIDDPFLASELAVDGTDVMKALDLGPGRSLGRILTSLHTYVLEEPAHNTREQLLERAKQLELELGR